MGLLILNVVMGLCNMKHAAYHFESVKLRLNPHFEDTAFCPRMACMVSVKPLQPLYWRILVFEGTQLWAGTGRERR